MLHRKSRTPLSTDDQGSDAGTISFTNCPAKTFQGSDGCTTPGRSVPDHCHIVGAVAQRLIELYPSGLQSALFPPDAAFAAACHDIGKVSPSFVEKLRRGCTSGMGHIPKQAISPELEKQWGGHAGVSQAAAKALGAPAWIAEIVGQHHGFSPQLGGKQADAAVFGGSAWQAQRAALVQELQQRLGMSWPHIASAAQARLVAGLTSVADWIGSGPHFEDPTQPWQGLIDTALREAGWVAPATGQGLVLPMSSALPPAPRSSSC